MSQNLQSDVWAQSEDYIDKIWSLDGFLSRNINPVMHMKLYTGIYDYITSPPTKDMRDWRDTGAANLYHHIETCLQKKVNNIYLNVNGMSDKDVFWLYQTHWNNYKTLCDFASRVYQYLNRHWVQTQLYNGRRDIFDIKLLSQQIWKNFFFKPLFPRITRTSLNLIKLNRNNHSSVDTQSIKNVLQLYSNQNFIEMIKNDPQFESIDDIYTECFEIEFLREVHDFYRRQKIPSLESNRILEYLTSIATHFDYEINFAKSYLPEEKSTLKNLIDILEEIFIVNDTLSIILEKIEPLIRNENNHPELAILHQPMSRIPKIKNELTILIENYIHQMGIDAIHLVSGPAINDPKVYIDTILDVHKKSLKLIQELFNGEQDFTVALDKACSKFINNNKVTQTAGSTAKSPELLARYCDALLRKGSKAVEETDLEEKFNQIMIIFNYVEDKDVYQKLYGKMLAKRLVGQLSASVDYEVSIISKLKQICGFEYTSKLEQMFQDISVSKTLTVEHEKYCENHHLTDIVDFSVMVLSSNSWPFSIPSNFALPIELKYTFDSFTKFYTHHHSGRKLTWLHQHSKGELQTFFTSQKYILQVSTYQMVILLLFNKVMIWTVERLQDETQIKSELLLQVLLSLLKSKLLVCTDINEDEEMKDTDIKMNHSIRLVTDFKSKKLRINLNVPLKSVEQKDIESVHRTIDEDRKMVIQAAIIRIMKSRQTLKYTLLMQEVIQQLSSHFKLNIAVIKKCIDILIQKEYLKRDSNENDVLCYLA